VWVQRLSGPGYPFVNEQTQADLPPTVWYRYRVSILLLLLLLQLLPIRPSGLSRFGINLKLLIFPSSAGLLGRGLAHWKSQPIQKHAHKPQVWYEFAIPAFDGIQCVQKAWNQVTVLAHRWIMHLFRIIRSYYGSLLYGGWLHWISHLSSRKWSGYTTRGWKTAESALWETNSVRVVLAARKKFAELWQRKCV
jgi:hypothetical protein